MGATETNPLERYGTRLVADQAITSAAGTGLNHRDRLLWIYGSDGRQRPAVQPSVQPRTPANADAGRQLRTA